MNRTENDNGDWARNTALLSPSCHESTDGQLTASAENAQPWGVILIQNAGLAFIGTPEMIADQLRPFQRLGVRHIIVSNVADYPNPDGAIQFAEEVIPLMR